MDKQKLVDELFACAEDDWLALWMIAGDVEAELDIDDPAPGTLPSSGCDRRIHTP